MKEQIEKRLTELRAEFESGQKMMTELESRMAKLRDSMLRIAGAIQMLEELLEQPASPPSHRPGSET